MPWLPADLVWLDLATDASEGDTLTARVRTPAGELQVMATIEIEGRILVLHGLHIHTENGPNSIGVANLRAIAELVLEKVDCDEARIEGTARTTGANPGHRTRVLRFTRRPGAAAG